VTFPLNDNWGCCECSWEKLHKWALKRGIVSELDGPEEIAQRIMRLPDRMEARIQYLQSLVDARPNE
jgi:hypothetical protein